MDHLAKLFLLAVILSVVQSVPLDTLQGINTITQSSGGSGLTSGGSNDGGLLGGLLGGGGILGALAGRGLGSSNCSALAQIVASLVASTNAAVVPDLLEAIVGPCPKVACGAIPLVVRALVGQGNTAAIPRLLTDLLGMCEDKQACKMMPEIMKKMLEQGKYEEAASFAVQMMCSCKNNPEFSGFLPELVQALTGNKGLLGQLLTALIGIPTDGNYCGGQGGNNGGGQGGNNGGCQCGNNGGSQCGNNGGCQCGNNGGGQCGNNGGGQCGNNGGCQCGNNGGGQCGYNGGGQVGNNGGCQCGNNGGGQCGNNGGQCGNNGGGQCGNNGGCQCGNNGGGQGGNNGGGGSNRQTPDKDGETCALIPKIIKAYGLEGDGMVESYLGSCHGTKNCALLKEIAQLLMKSKQTPKRRRLLKKVLTLIIKNCKGGDGETPEVPYLDGPDCDLILEALRMFIRGGEGYFTDKHLIDGLLKIYLGNCKHEHCGPYSQTDVLHPGIQQPFPPVNLLLPPGGCPFAHVF